MRRAFQRNARTLARRAVETFERSFERASAVLMPQLAGAAPWDGIWLMAVPKKRVRVCVGVARAERARGAVLSTPLARAPTFRRVVSLTLPPSFHFRPRLFSLSRRSLTRGSASAQGSATSWTTTTRSQRVKSVGASRRSTSCTTARRLRKIAAFRTTRTLYECRLRRSRRGSRPLLRSAMAFLGMGSIVLRRLLLRVEPRSNARRRRAR